MYFEHALQWIIFMVVLGHAQRYVNYGKVNFTDKVPFTSKSKLPVFLINSMLNDQDSHLKSLNSLIGNKC